MKRRAATLPVSSWLGSRRGRLGQTRGVAEFRHRHRFDLADPLPGDAEASPDLVEGLWSTTVEAEALAQNQPLPLSQRCQQRGDLLWQQRLDSCLCRFDGGVVGDHVAELAAELRERQEFLAETPSATDPTPRPLRSGSAWASMPRLFAHTS